MSALFASGDITANGSTVIDLQAAQAVRNSGWDRWTLLLQGTWDGSAIFPRFVDSEGVAIPIFNRMGGGEVQLFASSNAEIRFDYKGDTLHLFNSGGSGSIDVHWELYN